MTSRDGWSKAVTGFRVFGSAFSATTMWPPYLPGSLPVTRVSSPRAIGCESGAAIATVVAINESQSKIGHDPLDRLFNIALKEAIRRFTPRLIVRAFAGRRRH